MQHHTHFKVLDGWRGLSICLVLVAHIVPLPFGPKTMDWLFHKLNTWSPGFLAHVPQAWAVNDSVGILGMVLFFNLSGFLITSFLLRPSATVSDFLIRRFFRIVPVVWLFLALVLPFSERANLETWAAHYFFYANLPPSHLVQLTDHLWSLCVEMQFYIGVAILFFLFRVKGILVLPLFGLFFTLFRIYHHVYASSVTYFRMDEILAGCTLALVYQGRLGRVGEALLRFMQTVPRWPLVWLLIASCFHQGEWLNFARPYLAAALIGATLLNPGIAMVQRLQARPWIYLAGISYALYVWHVGLTGTWLWTGDTVMERMAKRPLFLVVLFVLAHCSTYYYEHRWMALGKALSAKLRPAAI